MIAINPLSSESERGEQRGFANLVRGTFGMFRNTGNLGVCYVGGVDKAGNPKDTRTLAQRTALARLIRQYQAKVPGLIVRGHRDWPNVAKACPSFDVAAWIKGGMA